MGTPNTIEVDGVKYVKQEAFVATPTPKPVPEPNNQDCDGRSLSTGKYAYVRLSALDTYSFINEGNRNGKVSGMADGKVQLEFPTLVGGSHFQTFPRQHIRRLAA